MTRLPALIHSLASSYGAVFLGVMAALVLAGCGRKTDRPVGETKPPAAEPPVLQIPKVSRPPVIDGTLEPDEWSRAAEISGFIGVTGAQAGRMVPQESRIFLAHDGKRFYLAVHSELPEGAKPSMTYRRRDEPVYLDNTQFELWLTPPGEGDPVAYQLIGNAYGAVFDNRQRPQLGVVDVSWNGAWEFKNTHVRGKAWTSELAIDFSELSDQPVTPDQLWRGLVAVAWPQRSWPYTFGFYKAIDTHARFRFADDSSAVQIQDLRSLIDNRMAPELRLVNGSGRKQRFEVTMESAGVRHEARVDVPAGAVLPYSFDKSLPPFPQGTRSLSATLRVRDGSGRVLLNGDWYYAPPGPPAPPRGKKPAETGPFLSRVQFAPVSMGVRAWADLLDYPRRDALDAVAFSFVPAKGGKPVTREVVHQFAYDSAETYLWLPKQLAHGDYLTRIEFLDAQGRVLDRAEHPVTHQNLASKFIWLDNTLGEKIEVRPPFEPVRVEGRHLEVWGRRIEMEGAFPSQITSQGRALLNRPIGLVAERAGVRQEARPVRPFELRSASKETATFSGSYQVAGMRVDLEGRLEFDGMLHYQLKAEPLQGNAGETVDRLFLVMPVKREHATYYFSTGGGWNPAYGLTEEPGGKAAADGPVWDSSRHGDFVPYVGLTDDDVALQWFGDHDHDTVLGNEVPAAAVVRRGDAVEVQVNLARRAGPLPAFAASFGFIASPVRPVLPHWRHTVLDAAPFAGSKVNFFYGPGHGGTPIDLHDTARLAKALGIETGGKNPDQVLRDRPPQDYRKVPREHILAALQPDKKNALDRVWDKGTEDPLQTIPCYFYNAKMYFEGNRSEAFRTFFPGEWQLDPPSGWFHLTPTESYADFFAFHLDLWFKHWAVPGLYFDEVYLGPDRNVFNGNGKVMPDGSVRATFPLMRQRTYMQRMRQLYFDNNRTPFLWVHTTDYMAPHAISPVEIAMFGENAAPTPTRDIIDTIHPLLFRSIGRAQKFGFVPVWMTMSGRGGGSPWSLAGRQALGWCWMHDTVPEIHTTQRGRNLVAMRAHWGIDGEDVSFIPYWKTGGALRASDPRFIVSAWTRPGGRVLLAVMNLHRTGEGRESARVEINPAALGLDGKFVVKDLESGPVGRALLEGAARVDAVLAATTERNPAAVRELAEPLAELQSRALEDWDRLAVLSNKTSFKVGVPRRDFRLYIIEPESADKPEP